MQRSVCIRSNIGPCFYYCEYFTMLLYRPGFMSTEILNLLKEGQTEQCF